MSFTLTAFPSLPKENVSLIKEINELRRELKLTRSQIYDLESALKLSKKARPQEVPETGNATGSWALRPRPDGGHEQGSLWLLSVSAHIHWWHFRAPLWHTLPLQRICGALPAAMLSLTGHGRLSEVLGVSYNSELRILQVLERTCCILCNIPTGSGAVP